MPTTQARYFTTDALAFLDDLERHNNREWFAQNKDRFERSLRDPFLRLLADLKPRMAKSVSARFIVDDKRTGGSLARIYKDMRFAKDGLPFKTALSAHFHHETSIRAPAFTLRIAPGATTLGAGIWKPEPLHADKIRAAIAKDGARFAKITKATKGVKLVGDSLRNAPEGFDPAHPRVDDLKRRDFVLRLSFSDRDVTSAHLLDDVVDGCKALAPFMAFVTGAVGLKP